MADLKVGNVARCHHGLTGLITRIKTEVANKKRYIVYKGVCLDSDKAGKDWQSAVPKLVAETLDGWIKIRAAELMDGRSETNFYLVERKNAWGGFSATAVFLDKDKAQVLADSYGTNEEWKPCGLVTKVSFIGD